MRLLFLFLIFILNCAFFNAQSKNYILIDTESKKEYARKDSLSAVIFLDSLVQNHFFFTEVKEVKAEKNTIKIFYQKGENFNEAWVEISDDIVADLKMKKKFFTKNLDSLKQKINQNYVEKGFSFNRVKSRYLGLEKAKPRVEISVFKNTQRTIDGFVFKGYEKLPTRFIRNLHNEFRGKIYDDNHLQQIHLQFQNHPFIQLQQVPQTLFTKDSTQIYLFTEKRKMNTFDGIIGFGNDKNEKLTFNGTLNVNFRNLFNGFEDISIFWQRNPDRSQSFDLQVDVPYLLKSNIGTQMNVNIFRQDSTFAVVKFNPSFYYNINRKIKIGLRGRLEVSTVADPLYTQGQDYNKQGLGLWYNFTEPTTVALFSHKSKVYFSADGLAAKYQAKRKSTQWQYEFLAEHNLNIKHQHWLNLKAESALLSSKIDLMDNELLRFGGWNSLRGFNEKSLLANFYYYGNAEYRYLINEQAFFDIFLQYGQLNNHSLRLKPKLYSFGLGFNFFLPIGLMSFQISNGNELGNSLDFRNTKIHWGILSRF